MKTFFHNKHLFVLFFSVLLLINSKTTAQDFIDKFEGIPIFTSPIWWGWFQEDRFPDFTDSLKAAGVDVLINGLSDPPQGANEPDAAKKINILNNYDLKILAIDAKNLNYIQYYTDAKYSVWKAIGTPSNEGNATLYRNTSKTEVVNNSYIRIKSQFAEDTCKMTWGPYYKQDLKYQIQYEDTSLIVIYRAAFDLKIEHNPASAHYPPMESDNPEDTICVIQVTRSTCSSIGTFNCTDTINAMVIKRGDFDGLNQFKELYFEYTLLDDPCSGSSTPNPDFPPPQHQVNIYRPEEIPPGPRADSEYIQFNVLWQGNSRYLLSLDKVTVSDERGRRLFGPDSSVAHSKIEQQLDTLGNANELVVGWLGVDEPTSIDQYEPIKKVKRLLDEKNMNKPLVIPWMGRWNGLVNHINDFGAMSIDPWQEYLIKGGNLNIQQNFLYVRLSLFPGAYSSLL